MHPSMKGVRAVFFDAVGTLLLPAEPVAATYRKIASHHGLDLDEITIRDRLIAAFERQERVDHAAMWRTNEAREIQRWQSIVSETLAQADNPLACFEELWAWYSDAKAWTANPETAEILGVLHQRGFTLGMASNFDARLNGIIGQMNEFALVRDRCVVSSLVTWRKPSAEFFAEVARVAGQEPEQVLFVGDDRRNDLEGAIASGFRGLLLDSQMKEEKGADRIRRLQELVV